VLSSFWLAARQRLSAIRSSLFARLRLWVVRVLQQLGILSGANVPAFSVDSSRQVVDSLRALPGRAIPGENARPLQGDPAGLGYKIYPFAE
jgi:hypothetical protein